MKNIRYKVLSGTLMAIMGLSFASCSLDLSPVDYYGSSNYWSNKEQVTAYVDGMAKNMRDASFNHTILFGEMRGGQHIVGTCADGSSSDYGELCLQNLSVENYGVANFGNYYGYLANVNLFIDRVEKATFLSDADKAYYLGIGYGMRAFYYFDLYRIYGSCPLRLTPDVIDGELDVTKLYMTRNKGSEVLAQIKSDIQKSIDNFGTVTSFDPNNRGNKKSYWSKAATEMLAGEVYLWSSKVAVDDQNANTGDLSTAKKYFEDVMNNYGLSLQSSFANVFNAGNKGNSEVIMAVRFAEGEATNSNYIYTYNIGTGQTSGNAFMRDGSKFVDPLQLAGASGVQRVEYKKQMYDQFDETDSRRDATFLTSWNKDASGNLVWRGCYVCKNIGEISSTTKLRVWDGDYIIYRLPEVLLSLAEIANMEGDGATVAKYINMVRERAYGTNWADQYKYTATNDFTTNELSILKEKDKEFIQEGQRWYDLRRMTLTKGGKHLIFCKEGNVEGTEPLLNESTEAYKVLWPLNTSLLSNDKALTQTPGY